VGNPLLRNFSTIGGHMARGKLSDVVPVFLALDCEVHFYDGTNRSSALGAYYEEGAHRAPHIVTALTLAPLPERSAAAFIRFAKTVFDFPLLNVACRVDDGGEIRIVFGATPRRSQRAPMAESIIAQHGLTDAAINQAALAARGEIRTGGGWVASPEYRTQLVEVLARRCLGLVAERMEST
jgi:CO/xanthine dehydrogenase FAD-binding subunit